MTRIIIVDDHALFRGGLRGLLQRTERFETVAEAASGEEFLRLLPDTEADVVIMDYSMPGMNGDEATRRALEIRPSLRIITLSMFGEWQYYRRMVEAGACGFVLKDSDIDEVTEAIDTVAGGGSYFSPALLESISGQMHANSIATDTLSEREIEILVCICRGMSNQEIADSLFISKRTVDKHRANILEKTGCRNTASLVVYAIKNDLAKL